MDFISYNIKKRFAFMPSIIQVTIFFFASTFMIIYNTLFIKIEDKNWINDLEEGIFWFFLVFSFLFFITLLIRMFSYDLPTKKQFYIHKTFFIIAQIIMFSVSFSSAITFIQAKDVSLGHGFRDDFYKDFIAAVLFLMSAMAVFASLPAIILKSPYSKSDKEVNND